MSSAGAVCTKVVHEDVVLLGSSGGVYALLAAHLADIILVSSLCVRSVTFFTYARMCVHVHVRSWAYWTIHIMCVVYMYMYVYHPI